MSRIVIFMLMVACHEASHLSFAAESEPKCDRVNWLVHQHALNATNNVLEWAMKNPMVNFLRDKFQGLHFYHKDNNIEDMRMDGIAYKRKSALVDVVIPDARTIKVLPIRPISNSTLRFRAFSNDSVRTHVKFVMSYQKKTYKAPLLGYRHCPFEWEIWEECPTTTVEVSASFDIMNAYYEMDADLFVFKCGGNFFEQVACNFQTVWQYGAALVKKNFPDELLKRMDHANVVSVTTDFDHGELNTTSKYTRVRGDTNLLEVVEEDAVRYVRDNITKTWLKHVFFGGLNWKIRQLINDWLEHNRHKLLGRCV